MDHRLVITKLNNIRMFFYFEDTKISAISCYEEASILGNIYVGRVSNVMNNINAIFVDIVRGESCYLSMEDLPEGMKIPKKDDLLLVQVVKDKIKTKQATVTTKITLTGDNVVVCNDKQIGISKKIADVGKRNALKKQFQYTISQFMHQNNCEDMCFGGIVRTGAEHIDIALLDKETITLLCELKEIIERSTYATAYSCMWKNKSAEFFDYQKYLLLDDLDVVTDDEEFCALCDEYLLPKPRLYTDQTIDLAPFYNLSTIVDKAMQERAYLKSGAYLVIQQTEAMTVIDVNSGKSIKGNSNSEALLKINLEAAKEIARQLRIRNLSGIILIDFINMKADKDSACLLSALREYVSADWILTTVHDITKLGLVEVTRKKIRKPLYEIIKNT